MSIDPSEPGVALKLLRILSHDLRAPMGALIGTSDMLQQGIYGELSPAQGRAVARLQRSSQRVMTLLDDFMLYAKAAAGEVSTAVQPFAPAALIESALDDIRPSAAEHGLAIHWQGGDTLPEQITTHEELVKRALMALLWNAVAFAQTRIEVETQWRNGWWVCVGDDGRAIPPDHSETIFEPFWRDPNPGRQVPTSGSGLGLALARAVARALGGEVEIASTGATGSAFCLFVPEKKTD